MRPTDALWHQVEMGAMGLEYGEDGSRKDSGRLVNHNWVGTPPIVRKYLKGRQIVSGVA
jgi:hypothetical protein